MVTRVTVIFTPAHGIDFRMNFYVAGAVVDPTDAAIQAILAALNGMTRAVAIEVELTVIAGVTDSAVVGANYISEDKAMFSFVDESGHPHNYKVPGPLESVFDANKETVDQTDPLVTAFVSAINTHARGRGGVDVTTLVSATRRENRKRLKSAPQID